MVQAKKDENGIPVLMGVSNADGVTPIMVYVDPVTHRLLVDLAGGSGTVTSMSVVTANGISGSVATATTTPAITLTLGNITPSGVQISGLTASEMVGTDASKNLVSLAVATYPSLTELTYVKGVTSAIQTQLGARELLTNKSTDTALGTSDTLYPSQKAVKSYVDSLVAGLLDYRGAYDASVNTFPAAGGSGTAGAVLKGDMWIMSVAGTLGGVAVQIGDSVIANVDTPGQTAGNWNILNANISYVPEDVANKVTSISGASTDTQYPSAKLVYDQLALKAAVAGSTSQVFSVSSLELGHASDTSITRVSAGVIAVEGVNVLTTATGLPLAGGTMSGNIQLGENTSLALDPAGSADGKYSGITISGTAGATLAFGDVIVLDVTASKWLLADANSAAAADGDARGLIGMCVLAANDTQATTILLNGTCRADANFPALTITAPVYLSETAGDIVVAQPTTTDVVIRVLGFALTADEIYFSPSSDYLTHV